LLLEIHRDQLHPRLRSLEPRHCHPPNALWPIIP
jgi:hypothetical protein